jgi:hypothetical protein
MAQVAVSRLDFGYFVRPPEETGTRAARVEACLGYLVEHPDGLILRAGGAAWGPKHRWTPVEMSPPGRAGRPGDLNTGGRRWRCPHPGGPAVCQGRRACLGT